MAEWWIEAGIGETRAALVDQDRILEARIEPDEPGPRAGAVLAARLRPNRIAESDSGDPILLDAIPRGIPEGSVIRVLVTREALPEPGKPKRALGRTVPPDTPLADAPTLAEELAATGLAITMGTPEGWADVLEEAATGHVAFPGGALQISLTPAMTVIDVDGTLPLAELALAGASAAGAAIRRLGITGSIGIDFPTVSDKGIRNAIAVALRAALPGPFEATAVNGFGFMQIIRPRLRASLPELVQRDPAGAAARTLLSQAQRSGLSGAVTLTACPAVIARLRARPDWLEVLSRQLGGQAGLREDAGLGMGAGHVAQTQR